MNFVDSYSKSGRKPSILTFLVLFSCFLFFFAGNSLNVTIFSIGIRLTEIILFIVSAFTFFYIKTRHKIKLFSHFLKDPISLLFIWIVFSSFVSILLTLVGIYTFQSLLEGILYPIRLLFFVFVVYIYKNYFDLLGIKHSKIENIIIRAFLLTCLVGFVQYFLFPRARDFYYLFLKIGVNWYYGSDPHIGRMVGLYFDPNYFSSILIIPTAITIKNLFNEKDSSSRAKHLLFLIIFVASILLTKSRSGFLGLIVLLPIQLIYTGIKKQNYPLIIVFMIISLFTIIILPFLNISVVNRVLSGVSDPSAQSRFWKWKIGIDAFASSPVLGIGFNMSKAYYETVNYSIVGTGNDSSLIQVLMCSGTIGIIIFLFYLFNLFRNNKINPEYKFVYLAGLVICNFNELLFNPLWFFPITLLITNSYYYKRNIVFKKKIRDLLIINNIYEIVK